MQQQITEYDVKINANEKEKLKKHNFLSNEEVVQYSLIKKLLSKIAFDDNEKSIRIWYQ